jgi:hypothetical protein
MPWFVPLLPLLPIAFVAVPLLVWFLFWRWLRVGDTLSQTYYLMWAARSQKTGERRWKGGSVSIPLLPLRLTSNGFRVTFLGDEVLFREITKVEPFSWPLLTGVRLSLNDERMLAMIFMTRFGHERFLKLLKSRAVSAQGVTP